MLGQTAKKRSEYTIKPERSKRSCPIKTRLFCYHFTLLYICKAGIDTDRNEKVIHIKRETETGTSERKAVRNQIARHVQAMVKERA